MSKKSDRPDPVVGTIPATLEKAQRAMSVLSEGDRAHVYFDPSESDTVGLLTFPLGMRELVERALSN